MYDSAFDRFVCIEELAIAWRGLDIQVLLDCTLDLASAERELFRHHHLGIASADVMSLTVETARCLRTPKSLQRLERIAESLELDDILASLQEAAAQGDDGREHEPALDYDNLLAELTETAGDQQKQRVGATATLLDRIARLSRPMHERDAQFEGTNGEFAVSGTDWDGVRVWNNAPRARRFGFVVNGRWAYAPDKWFNYIGNPEYRAPDGYWLPGGNAGSLLAWGGRVPQFETLEDKEMEVQLNPGTAVLFLMNERAHSHYFADNAGQLAVLWHEIDIAFP